MKKTRFESFSDGVLAIKDKSFESIWKDKQFIEVVK